MSPRVPSAHFRRVSAGGSANGGGLTRGGGGGATELGPIAGFHSRHQRYLSKDRELLKFLESAVGKGSEIGAFISPFPIHRSSKMMVTSQTPPTPVRFVLRSRLTSRFRLLIAPSMWVRDSQRHARCNSCDYILRNEHLKSSCH